MIRINPPLNILILALAIFCIPCLAQKRQNSLQVNPPNSVHVFWHWMEGGITRDGITRDLESMKSAGISQATIICVSLMETKTLGIPYVEFASEEWFNLFRHALDKASALGITIGIHNSNGWSGSGGTWISPEQSMKSYTWSKFNHTGGNATIQLPKPKGNLDFYKDVAVIAISNAETTWTGVRPVITHNRKNTGVVLQDGSPATSLTVLPGDTIEFAFRQPVDLSAINLVAMHTSMWEEADMFRARWQLDWSKEESGPYTPEDTLLMSGSNRVFQAKTTLTKVKRLRLILSGAGSGPWVIPIQLGEAECLSENQAPLFSPKVPDFFAKTGFVRAKQEQFYSTAEYSGTGKQILDLTSDMDSTGMLKMNIREGNWTIIRFGYTTTGTTTNPVMTKEKGLECDKLDTTALNHHFSSFPARLVQYAGLHAGETFKFLLTDSWECNYHNWTENIPAVFLRKRGYDLKNWIPVLCGEQIASSEEEEAFLFDFRRTLAEMLEENYYAHLRNLCHRNKLELHAEVIYGTHGYPPVDILKSNSYMDMVMTEFWTSSDNQSIPRYTPQLQTSVSFPASAVRLYQKKILGAESFTGHAHYSESLRSLRPFGDMAFTEGINQFILHSYVHQPDERKPGMTLGRYASHFNRHNLYWSSMPDWNRYQSANQWLLQRGYTPTDVLYYVGDQYPQFTYSNQSNTPPHGYSITACNQDILENRARMMQGKLVINDRDSVSILTLSPYKTMTLKTLQMLAYFVRNGLIIYGPKPTQILGLMDLKENKKTFYDLADLLWGKDTGSINRIVGKGKVIWGMNLGDALQNEKIKPSFRGDSCRFIVSRTADSDAVFIFNQLNKPFSKAVQVKSQFKHGEVRDVLTGETYPVRIMHDSSISSFTLNLQPYQSLWVVLSDQKLADKRPVKDRSFPVNPLSIQLDLTDPFGKSETLKIDRLLWLHNHPSFQIKHFSGTMTYRIRFQKPKGIPKNQKLILDIGEFHSQASIVLNGRLVGNIWEQVGLPLTGLKEGINELTVHITNEYRNRMIGDLKEKGRLHQLWTSADISEYLNAQSTLLPSGLKGPLKIHTVK